jgi:hypothetical protein
MTTYEAVRAEALLNKRLLRQQLEADAAIAAGGLASNMTLRDHFAGQALAGWIASANSDDHFPPNTYAKIAYDQADAMLEARKTTGEGE